MSDQQTKLDAFMEDVKEQENKDKELRGSGEFEDRETLRADRDKLYEGYFLESFQSGIVGKFGENTAVRLISSTGEKVTLWVNGFEEQHFNQFIARLESDDMALPVKFSFMRTQKESEKGNTYNRLFIRLDAHGDDVAFEMDSL
jgi:hypothetical protein